MKSKSVVTLLVVLLFGMLITSCVDVPTEGPTPPDFKAEFRFVHAALDAGDVAVSVDGQSAGNMSFAGVLSHKSYQAGSRVVNVGGDVFNVAMSSEQRGTIVVLDKVGEDRTFLKLVERRIFDPATTEVGRYRVVHAADADAVDAVAYDVEVVGDTSVVINGMTNRDVTGYASIPAGTYEVSVYAPDDTVAVLTSSISLGNKRQTSIIVGDADAGTLAFVNLEDN